MHMALLGRLSIGQRVVIVIALALILAAVGVYVTSLRGPPANYGGIGYAPMTQAVVEPDLTPWEQLLVWLGLIGLWAALSVLLLHRIGSHVADSSEE